MDIVDEFGALGLALCLLAVLDEVAVRMQPAIRHGADPVAFRRHKVCKIAGKDRRTRAIADGYAALRRGNGRGCD